jgi:hypothetical protein
MLTHLVSHAQPAAAVVGDALPVLAPMHLHNTAYILICKNRHNLDCMARCRAQTPTCTRHHWNKCNMVNFSVTCVSAVILCPLSTYYLDMKDSNYTVEGTESDALARVQSPLQGPLSCAAAAPHHHHTPRPCQHHCSRHTCHRSPQSDRCRWPPPTWPSDDVDVSHAELAGWGRQEGAGSGARQRNARGMPRRAGSCRGWARRRSRGPPPGIVACQRPEQAPWRQQVWPAAAQSLHPETAMDQRSRCINSSQKPKVSSGESLYVLMSACCMPSGAGLMSCVGIIYIRLCAI